MRVPHARFTMACCHDVEESMNASARSCSAISLMHDQATAQTRALASYELGPRKLGIKEMSEQDRGAREPRQAWRRRVLRRLLHGVPLAETIQSLLAAVDTTFCPAAAEHVALDRC